MNRITPLQSVLLAIVAVMLIGSVATCSAAGPVNNNVTNVEHGTIVKDTNCKWFIKNDKVTLLSGRNEFCHGQPSKAVLIR